MDLSVPDEARQRHPSVFHETPCSICGASRSRSGPLSTESISQVEKVDLGASASPSSSSEFAMSSYPHIHDNNWGISVHHLQTVLLQQCRKTFSEVSARGELQNQDGPIYGVDGTMEQLVEYHIKPMTQRLKASYTDIVCMHYENASCFTGNLDDRIELHCGTARFMLSYSWGYRVEDVVDSLVEWCQQNQMSPKEVYVWICALNINQHCLLPDEPAHSLAATFQDRIKNISTILSLMIPWTQPDYVKRLWCLFEYHIAIRKKKRIDLLFTSKDIKILSTLLQAKDGGAKRTIDTMLRTVQSDKATATNNADELYIQNYIADHGGARVLDAAVRGHLSNQLLNVKFSKLLKIYTATIHVIVRCASSPGHTYVF